MKTQLLIGTALLAAISAFSQQGQGKPKPSGILNSIADLKHKSSESRPVATGRVASPSPLKQSSVNSSGTWQNFTSSMNIYGVSNSFVKPLQWNDELDVVSFIHRKSPSYVSSPSASSNAESGTIVSMISTDCGNHWDSTLMWVNDNFWGRYPSGAIYNPPGNTDIDKAYMVGAGPTTGAGNVTWTGNWYSSKKIGANTYDNMLSAVPNAQQLAQTAGPFLPNVPRHDFAAFGFSATDDGKVRILAGMGDDNLSPVSDTALMLVTGTFNNGIFDWKGQPFIIPVTKATDGSRNFIQRPMMAWNESGTVGYIVTMGSRQNAIGSNVGFQPIIYKTVDNGQTWSLENTIIDFNSSAYDDVKRSLPGLETNTTLVVPNFNWTEGSDCTVDANNKLHIFTSILGHPSDDPDELTQIFIFGSEKYLWQHTPGFRPYLYDFVYDGINPSWSHMLIDSMSSEGPGDRTTDPGYNYNPWDADPLESNNRLREDARLQISRTPDGQHLLYTWAESDTAFTDDQVKWNNQPNIKARLMDLQTPHLLNYEINVTESAPGEVISRATQHIVSPKFKLVSKTPERIIISVPMTVSNSNPYSQRTANTHWFSCAQLEFLRPVSADPFNYVGISENTILNNSSVYPNPAKTSVTLGINLPSPEKIHVTITNALGQIMKQTESTGAAGKNEINVSLDGASAGVYFVNIKIKNESSTKKLIIE